VKTPRSLKLFSQRARIFSAAGMHMFLPNSTRAVAPESRLSATLIRADGSLEDLGILSTKVITDAFVDYIVDELQSSSGGISGFRFHGSGIGVAAESQAQTALVSEVATRASGTQAEGSSTNIYRTVGVVSYAAAFAIREHGLFRASSGDVMADRSLFSAINVGNGDSIIFDYQLTLPAGN